MQLQEIAAMISAKRTQGKMELEISGLSQDSRSVEPGDLFFCVRGLKHNGFDYLKDAAQKGAVAAVVDTMPDDCCGISMIQIDDVNMAIQTIAPAFYHHPDRQLKLIGVVGTNGKTTSTYLIKSILEAAGYSVGLIGTIANYIKDQRLETHNTTPGFLENYRLFARMVAAGVDYVVMEVSSHSIDQGRVAGLFFRSGLFTNITQDHLDYHKTFDEYLRVKSKFFVDLPTTSWAVINADDAHADHFIGRTGAKVITYGLTPDAAVHAESIEMNPDGAAFRVVAPLGAIDLHLNLVGYFNVSNALGALTTCMALGIDLAVVKKGLETVAGVPGRFQLVPGSDTFEVIVDYAHTPDGLENLLRAGRQIARKRILLVFGCGGDRDRGKRPIMGEIAAKMADYTIITSDNPRSEEPASIIDQIEVGFKKGNPAAGYERIVDRSVAIRRVIDLADSGDIVLIAGKGHEDYQVLGDRVIHFDDKEVAHAALKERFHARV